jgi:hypothetical protein
MRRVRQILEATHEAHMLVDAWEARGKQIQCIRTAELAPHFVHGEEANVSYNDKKVVINGLSSFTT